MDHDTRAVLVALQRKEAAGNGRECHRDAAHQLGQHPGDTLRVARPDRQMMDHDFLPLLPLTP
jgi:hypothetical protein